MNELEAIRKCARDIVADPDAGSDAIVSASQLLRNAEEIEHRRAQTKQMREDLPESRLLQYMNLLAPVVTVLVLATTLIFQERDRANDQKDAQRDKTENRENEQWDRAIRAAADKQEDRTAAIVLLRGIEESTSRYSAPASKLVVSVLRGAKTFDEFQALFSAEFAPPGQQDVDRILDVDRAIHQEWVNRKKGDLRFADSNDEHMVIQELSFICTQAHPLLQKRPPNKFFDLSFVAFFDCSLSDVDLTKANLEGFTTARVTMNGARLDGVTQYKDSYWRDSEWWHVGSISPELGQYLCAEAPLTFRPENHYGTGAVPSPQDYQGALMKLGLRDCKAV